MEVHHKIAGVIIRNKKLLMVRKYDEPHFIMPGGRVKKKEKKDETLKRELKEELNINLVSMKFFAAKEAVHFQDKNKIIRMEMYFAEIEGEPQPTSEINEIKWIDSNYKKQEIKLASINEDFTIPELEKVAEFKISKFEEILRILDIMIISNIAFVYLHLLPVFNS